MNDVPTDDRSNVTEPSMQSAREAAIRDLAHHATNGTLTLDEYAERAIAAEHAATAEELDAAVHGLPEEAVTAAEAGRARWIIGVFGGTEQRGRWRLSSRLRVVALLGGATLDLGAAQPEAPVSVITVVAALGGAEIIAPQGLPIQFSGFSLFGGKGDKRTGGPPLAGAPLIHIRAFTILGGVTIKDRPPHRNLLEMIRGQKAKPTGA